MVIKVIKPGKKVFVRICPICGCEFEYGLDDLNPSDMVYCPECGHACTHVCPPDVPPIFSPEIVPFKKDIPLFKRDLPSTIEGDTYGCEGCIYYESIKNNPEGLGYTAGDTPCNWCLKRTITCKTIPASNTK